MKNIILFCLFLLSLSGETSAQKIISGNYGDGLEICYDNKTGIVTGYFESYTGLDEQTQKPRFSCIFYIEGKAIGSQFNIKTYYPSDKKDDLIIGTFEIVNNKTIKIKLPQEHGGCWNVQHFADKPEQFELEKQMNWIQIKYVDIDKAYFYKDKSIDTKKKAYLVKGDIVCIEKIEKEWAFCTYFTEKNRTSGWMMLSELNKNKF